MFRSIKKLFGQKPIEPSQEELQKLAESWHDDKSRHMETILGKEHDMVMHAIIPYAVGGGLDLYYFPNGISGTAVATKELSELPGQGSSNGNFKCYELAMFTKHQLNLDEAKDSGTSFGRAHSNINSILNILAPFSASATLNKFETCEFPQDMEKVGGKCFIFDAYGLPEDASRQQFGVMVAIEIHRSEMMYARERGGASLLSLLRQHGYYPYADLDRDPVA
jgi:hypothetical protein